MRDFFVDDFLVAVNREVVALRGDVGFGDEEGLLGALASVLAAVVGAVFGGKRGLSLAVALTPALSRKRARERMQRAPAGEDVGEIVLCVFF